MADISGTLGEVKFYGTLAQKRLIMPVITDAYEQTMLNSPAICRTMTIEGLRATLPIASGVTVHSQLDEFEHATSRNAKLDNFDMKLYKDTLFFDVSDEMEIESAASKFGSMMTWQQNQKSIALEDNLNKLIAAQLDTTPQQYDGDGDLGNWASVKPTLAIGKMSASMGVNKPTAIVMGTLAGEYYVDAVGDKVALANLNEWRNAASIHPTLNIPVYISTDIDNLDASGNSQVFAVSNRTPGVVSVISTIRAHEGYNMETGANQWRYDVWRTPFSNIRQNSDSKNLGVMWGYMTES